MGYIANSNAYNGTGGASASTIAVTLPVACAVGDVVLAAVAGDSSGGSITIDSVTSNNISWSRVLDFNHTGNAENFSLFRGKVTTAFSASSETITGNFSASTTYRHIDVVAYTPNSGKTFATEPVQQYGADTYAAASNPTGADGYSEALTTTGSGSFIIVGLMAVEDTTSNSTNDCDPGTGMTLRGAVHSMFDGAAGSMFPFLWMDKDQASAGATTVYGQHVQSSDYMSSLVAVALEMNSASGSYTLTAAQGSYSLTGQAAGLRASRILTAAQGSYSLSGQDATLRKSYPLVAAQGSYSLTGQDVGLRVTRILTAAQGSYALTGQAASLSYGKQLVAAQGSYSLTGQAAALRLARVVSAAQGSYSLTGQAANLIAARTLAAGQGTYALGGQAANLFAARRLTAAQGGYSLTGMAAGLLYSGGSPTLIAGMGGYSLTGQAAALRRSAVLTAAQGAYALDGQPAGLVYGKRMAADAGGYTITGQAATLRTARVLAAATGFYTLDGQPANLVHSGLPFEPEAESATGGWAHYFRAEQAALRRKHLRALAEEAEEASEREALAEALETALIADGTATQGDVDRLRLDQIAALYTDRTLLDRRAQRALAYAERSRTELATRLALRELQRQQEDEELAVLLVLAID